jgi:hypothetical protein
VARLGLGATRATGFALGRALALGAAFGLSFGVTLDRPFAEAFAVLMRALVLFFVTGLPRFAVAIGFPSPRHESGTNDFSNNKSRSSATAKAVMIVTFLCDGA